MTSRQVSYRAACIAVICWTIARAAVAQQAVGSASVTGIVLDPTSAIVQSATVRLRNEDTSQTQTVSTDDRGRYRFLYVPVGRYELSATAPGFGSTQLEFTLAVGSALDIPIRLAASASESITVTADAPVVETARTEISDVITPREVDALPLNGRNYLDLALLAPNVSRTNTRSAERFAETSAVAGTGLSVAGQRNLTNTFIVDGLSANDDAADLAGTSFAEEVIREFQVVTSGGTAEFGRASSGIINIVTKSGTNQFRGRGYGFFRNERWDGRNALATRKDPLSQGQFGGTASGPIARNRTFWFGNMERTQQDKNGVVTISPENTAAINAALASSGYRGQSIRTGEYLTGYSSTNLFGRLDHTPSESSRLQFRYSFYDVGSRNARGVGGLNAVTRGTPLDDTDHLVAVSWQRSLSPTVLNEARGQFTRSDLSAPANDAIGPAISVSGVANFGTSTSSPTGRDLRSLQAADTLTVQHGAHLVKVGIDLLYDHVQIDFPGALQGSYTLTSLPNLQRGIYQQFQQAFGDPSLVQSNPNAGIFLQDEWRYRSRLTINAGIRYDLQWLPDPIQLDANNVSPRLGVSWASADRRTVVRGSAGIYFDRIPLRATSNALQRDGVRYKVAVLSFGEPGAPAFPEVLPAFPAGVVTAITTIDPAIQNGRSVQAGWQVERALGRDTAVSLGYSHLRGRDIIMSRNVNVPTLTAAQAAARDVPNLGRPDPRFANISRFESIGDAWFDGITMSLNARATPLGSTRVSYTLSRALDTSGNAFFSTPQDNVNIAAEKGPSDNDQRHRFVLSGTLGGNAPAMRRALAGVEFGYVVSYATGVPFNVLAGSDLNADTNNNDRPRGVGRNSARQSSVASVDLRVSRSFGLRGAHRLEAIVEAFNVLNRVNILAVNSTFGSGATPLPAFGQPILAGDPRQIQVGVRWDF